MTGTLAVMTMPSWVSAEREQAGPMPLLLVQSFVNTWDGDHNSDLLLDPATARDWLTEAGLWTADRAPDPAELHRARAVREAVRALLMANSGGPAPAPGDIEPAAGRSPHAARPVLQVDQTGRSASASSRPTSPTRACSALLLVIRDAQRDGTWPRLKACGNPDCRWAFYDRSHGQVGAWCDMATCGNRIKNRRLRQRPAS